MAMSGARRVAGEANPGSPPERPDARGPAAALPAILGDSGAMAAVLREVQRAARFPVTVLLSGPSGTGKTALARLIHERGPRAARPFLELNCAALQETLVEAELFGYARGAFTGAVAEHDGLIAAAHHGTLFLDEVGELSLSSQARLLQFLQSGTVRRVGATADRRPDVRVIAATNVDLESAVAGRRFRDDLYYRLKVLTIRVPSLAERREDIPQLGAHFAALAARRHGLPALPLSPAARAALTLADWPGNVRQLENLVEMGVIRAAMDAAPAVDAEHLFPAAGPAAGGAERADRADDAPADFHEATRRFQRQLVARALEAAGWNVAGTARRLRLSRSHLNELIAEFGLARPLR